MPPGRAISGAPFGVGSGLTGGGGWVAAMGIAGSTFRLPENICIALISFELIMGQLFTKVNRRFALEPARPRAGAG
jgi:hypothetical protein